MFQRRFGITSATRYAWIGPAVVVLALLLIYVFGNDGDGLAPDVRTLERSDGHEYLKIGRAEGYTDLVASAPISADRRKAVLNNLSEFRAEHKLVGPGVIVTATGGAEPGRQLASTIGELLAHYNLGQYRADVDTFTDAVPEESNLVLYTKKADAVIARGLVEALSPMVVGSVAIVYRDELKTGSLHLLVRGDPAFTARGVAVFP